MFAPQTQATNDMSLNKRRRFAPNTLPIIASSEDGTETPILLDFYDQSPSQQEIESELLQVGMRIRKSVADGYQVPNPGRRAFTPRPFMNFSRLSPATAAAIQNQDPADGSSSAGGVGNLSTATFCGINLAMMSHISAAPAIEEQKLWSYSTSSKRRQHFEEDSDSDDSQEFMPRTPHLEFADDYAPIPQDYFNITTGSTEDVSPMTQVGASRLNVHHGRRMAQPRSRIRSQQQQQPAPVPMINPFAQIGPQPRSGFHGHQRMRSCGMEAMDFGEATFLQGRADVEMDCS